MPRPARFAAEAWPFTRRISTALSMSPSASESADLASMTPAWVRSRSSFTCAAEICVLIESSFFSPSAGAGVSACSAGVSSAGWAAGASGAAVSCGAACSAGAAGCSAGAAGAGASC